MTLIFVYRALVSTLSTLTGAGHNQLSVGQCCQTAAHTQQHSSSLTWGRATLKGSKLTASTSRTSKNLRTIKVLFIFILVFFYCWYLLSRCCRLLLLLLYKFNSRNIPTSRTHIFSVGQWAKKKRRNENKMQDIRLKFCCQFAFCPRLIASSCLSFHHYLAQRRGDKPQEASRHPAPSTDQHDRGRSSITSSSSLCSHF